jgi:hypothetical protein
MDVYNPGDAIPVKSICGLIYGQPGIGKTSLACTCEAPAILDLDRGAHRAHNYGLARVIRYSTTDEINPDDPVYDDRKTLVIDTAGKFLDLMSIDVIRSSPKPGSYGYSSTGLNQKGWGVLKNRFTGLMNRFIARGVDVLFISHMKESGDDEDKKYGLDMQGGSRDEVCKLCEIIGRVYFNRGHRKIDFSPSDHQVGKNGIGSTKPIDVPGVEAMSGFGAGLLAQTKANLTRMSEESLDIDKAVNEWRTMILACNEPDELNNLMFQGKDLAENIKIQVRPMFGWRAKAMSWVFDKNVSQFTKAS